MHIYLYNFYGNVHNHVQMHRLVFIRTLSIVHCLLLNKTVKYAHIIHEKVCM